MNKQDKVKEKQSNIEHHKLVIFLLTYFLLFFVILLGLFTIIKKPEQVEIRGIKENKSPTYIQP
jgi:cell division septal protein FtsQ